MYLRNRRHGYFVVGPSAFQTFRLYWQLKKLPPYIRLHEIALQAKMRNTRSAHAVENRPRAFPFPFRN